MDIAWLPEGGFVLCLLLGDLVAFELGQCVELVVSLVGLQPGHREDF